MSVCNLVACICSKSLDSVFEMWFHEGTVGPLCSYALYSLLVSAEAGYVFICVCFLN